MKFVALKLLLFSTLLIVSHDAKSSCFEPGFCGSDVEQKTPSCLETATVDSFDVDFLSPAHRWSHIKLVGWGEIAKDTTTQYRIAEAPTELDARYGEGPYHSLQYSKSIPADAPVKDSGIYLWDDGGKIRYAIPAAADGNRLNVEELQTYHRISDEQGVLYDFTLGISDTFRVPNLFDFGTNEERDIRLVVTAIDTVSLENGEERKQWSFEYIAGGRNLGPWGKWIDGIGDTGSFFGPAFTGLLDDGGPLLHCFQSNETILLSRGERCDRTTSLFQPAELRALPLKTFPNPSTGLINFDTELGLETVYVHDSAGRLVMSLQSPGSTLALSHLRQGMYTLRAVGRDGLVRSGKVVLRR